MGEFSAMVTACQHARVTPWRAVSTLRGPAVLFALVLLFGTACASRAPGVGEPLSEDERIIAEVERIFADEEGIVAEDLEVEVDAGVVVITGVQRELEPVRRMLRRVARMRGVIEVVNRIRIVRERPARA